MELFKVCAQPVYEEVSDLYLRTRIGAAGFHNGDYVLSPGSEISTDTYFNIFSSSKYGEYTIADEISITTWVSGRLDVKLCSCSSSGERTISVRTIDSKVPEEIRFSFNIKNLDDPDPVCHYLLYRAHDESSIHSFGSYFSNVEPKGIDVGIVICTFKREERVKRNIENIGSSISDGKYGLSGKVTLYVVDNGRTLSKEMIDDEGIRLISNRNNGGSGGFTRGIIEARRDDKTHIILMDDDIEMDPNVIYKTFNLMSILNDEHKDAFILGGMLLPESPTVQYEAGSEYLHGFKRGKHMLDLTEVNTLLRNDTYEPADYGGWWFMAMPSSAAEELPLPLFIKLDDVEFGIRRMHDHIVMNGIGVWHDSFESKTNPVTDFYFLRRNLLILYSLYNKSNGLQVGISHLRNMLHCIKEQKIEEYFFTREAVNDFLKGPEYIMNADQENIIKSYAQHKEEMISDETSDKGLRKNSEKNIRQISFSCLIPSIVESFRIAIRWNKLTKRYRDSAKYLTSFEYWEGNSE